MKNTLLPLLTVLATAPLAHALDTTAWQFRQTVEAAPGELVSLALPDATLDAASPDLADVRLVDATGTEIPYVADTSTYSAALKGARVAPPKTFLTRMDYGATVILLETGLTDPMGGVDLTTPAPEFLKPVRVEGSGDGENWTLLAHSLPVFRQKNGAENLRVNFPAGVHKHLRITVDDAKSDAVPFTGATLRGADTTLRAARDERAAVPAKILSRTEKPGVTELRLDLGAQNLPLGGITLETPERFFTRRVTVTCRVTEEEIPREVTLARDSLWSITGDDVETSSRKRLPVETRVPAREILVNIANGDSPPLAIDAVRVDRRPRRLLFVAPRGGIFLLSGNPAATPPHYDLAALSSKIKAAPSAAASAAATLTPNPGYKPYTPPPPPVIAGAPLDTDEWGARKPVTANAPGAQRLELDAETLAASRADLGDLRLMTGDRQIPYLSEHTGLTRELPVAASQDTTTAKPSITRWRVDTPKGALPVIDISCLADTPVFNRTVRLLRLVSDARDGRREIELTSATWARTGASDEPLRLGLSGAPLSGPLVLEIADAGGAPLALRGFTLRYPVTRLLFATADSAPVHLYYGNPDAAAPHYADLELVAGKLRAARPTTATAGPEERLNSTPGSASRRHSGPLLWVALAAVVAGLLYVVARMLPKGESK